MFATLLLTMSSACLAQSHSDLSTRFQNIQDQMSSHRESLYVRTDTDLQFCKKLGKFSESVFVWADAGRDLQNVVAVGDDELTLTDTYRSELRRQTESLNQFCNTEDRVDRESIFGVIQNIGALQSKFVQSLSATRKQ